ncbi:MAG: glycoside hydrolase, partial [Deltaproteobacteria bacterium]
YEEHAPLMRFFKDSGLPSPKAFNTAAELVLNGSLRRAFENEQFDLEVIESLLKEAKEEGVILDAATLEFSIRKKLEHMAKRFSADPIKLSQLQELESAVSLVRSLPFQVNLWKVQNICYEILQSMHPDLLQKAEEGDKTSQEWIKHFKTLAGSLSLRIS